MSATYIGHGNILWVIYANKIKYHKFPVLEVLQSTVTFTDDVTAQPHHIPTAPTPVKLLFSMTSELRHCLATQLTRLHTSHFLIIPETVWRPPIRLSSTSL